MGDIDDREASSREPTKEAKEPLDVDAGEAAGRLVEDEHAGVAKKRARDLDDLLLRDRERAHGASGEISPCSRDERASRARALISERRRIPKREDSIPRNRFSATSR